jgi:curli biogenesis system outer membrane secretion channel CsgG
MLFSGTLCFAEEAAGEAAAAPAKQPASSSTHHRKRIAVVNFDIPAETCSGWGKQAEAQAAATRLSTVLTDMLISSLVNTGAFDVIERTQLDSLLKEQKLSAEGILDPKTAPQAGKILGVDLVIGGKLTEFGLKEKRGGGLGVITSGVLGVDIKKSTVRTVIDARIIDTTTGRILTAAQGTGENSDSKLAFAGSDFAHFLGAVNFESTEWTESRMGKCTRTAVDQVVNKVIELFPVEATVLGVLPDGGIILDLGRFNGITKDSRFDIVQINLMLDEESGEVIYEDRKVLGAAHVVDVQDNRCKVVADAPFTDGITPRKGDMALLKKVQPPAEKKK